MNLEAWLKVLVEFGSILHVDHVRFDLCHPYIHPYFVYSVGLCTPACFTCTQCIGNSDQRDTDGDGVGDFCDNCVFTANQKQENSDGDRAGRACDADDNNPEVGE